MASGSDEIALEFPKFIRIYKDGRVERLGGIDVVPPSTDPITGVESKDIVIDPVSRVWARLYKPKLAHSAQKLPLLVYFHGGGFIIETTASPLYHNYLNSLAAEAGVLVISVDYRRAPENPLPAAYDDCWTVLRWVESHSGGSASDPWMKELADFDRVFFAGDSAGANLAHHMALRIGSEGLGLVKLVGVALIHPYFWAEEPIGFESEKPELKAIIGKIWRVAFPSSSGLDDPWINPMKDPSLSKLGCSRVLVCVAGKDDLRERGRIYCKELDPVEFRGEVELLEME
ncbi:Carboxylesterase [Bertholletia excelsa]